jgi:hypothetical protein
MKYAVQVGPGGDLRSPTYTDTLRARLSHKPDTYRHTESKVISQDGHIGTLRAR